MSSSRLIEVFGHIVFSFTRGVTEHYNPQEPEFTAESFGYDPLQSTGREWYYHPVDELIYQEYSDREAASFNFPAYAGLDIRVINACSTEENNETQDDQQDEDRAMAWKRLRPSALRTIWKSMYTGTLISLLTATVLGLVYMFISYISFNTLHCCEFQSGEEPIPEKVQWIRTTSSVISCAFLYIWYFASMLFLFRPYQIMGVKRKLFLVCCLVYCLDSLYRFALQALRISHSKVSALQKIPLDILFLISVSWQVYLLTNHFCIQSRRRRVILFLQMIIPGCFSFIFAITTTSFIYPVYSKENKEGKLLIALFTPLIAVVLKVISRISVQRLWNVAHPGYSHVLLAPLYCGSAVLLRILQADLGSLQPIAILGIIHGVAEVIERSAMVVIDHICQVIWKRTSAPWGSFRTPRRERLINNYSTSARWI